MSIQPSFQGEVMLAGWSETHNGGAKVTFWLQDSDDLEAFKRMTVAKGKTAGQRLALVAVEIGGDEQPVQRQDKPKGGELARLAGQLCQNSQFQEWCESESAEAAAEWLRSVCDIESRAELDHDAGAANKFHQLVRLPYLEWRGE